MTILYKYLTLFYTFHCRFPLGLPLGVLYKRKPIFYEQKSSAYFICID
jgi:hypothetical protein